MSAGWRHREPAALRMRSDSHRVHPPRILHEGANLRGCFNREPALFDFHRVPPCKKYRPHRHAVDQHSARQFLGIDRKDRSTKMSRVTKAGAAIANSISI